MKRIFILALAAFAVMSCSKEGNNGNGGEESGKGYATFRFKFDSGTKTRAVTDYNPEKGYVDAAEANDALFTEARILIFNANSGALEVNEKITGSSKTFLLTAGKKKIFVFSNTDGLEDNPTAVNANAEYRLADATGGMIVGSSTLTDFYKLNYDAGTPELEDATRAGLPTFRMTNLHKRVTDGVKGMPMSNTDQFEYTIKANVSESDSQSGTPSDGPTDNNNSFKIKIYYMLAKARLVMGATALGTQGDGTVISTPTYAIWNLAKKTNYTQKYTTGEPTSYYHTMYSNTTPVATLEANFDRSANINVPSSTTATSCDYLYVPENTGQALLRGQMSYFAIKMTYKPGKVITGVAFDLTDRVAYTTKTLDAAAADASGDMTYYYTRQSIENIPAGYCFKNTDLLKQAAWMMKNNLPWTGSAQQMTEADALVTPSMIYKFENATSYYRLNLGIGSGNATDYGVLRGNKYTATVNSITGPGVPTEKDLTIDPLEPVVARTYITATIEAAAWTAVSQDDDLN